jgi:hypothetical protein
VIVRGYPPRGNDRLCDRVTTTKEGRSTERPFHKGEHERAISSVRVRPN